MFEQDVRWREGFLDATENNISFAILSVVNGIKLLENNISFATICRLVNGKVQRLYKGKQIL